MDGRISRDSGLAGFSVQEWLSRVPILIIYIPLAVSEPFPLFTGAPLDPLSALHGCLPYGETPHEKSVAGFTATKICRSQLDAHLDQTAQRERARPDSLRQVVSTHGYLVKLLREYGGEARRSLASKYLHFHRPFAFFIFDRFAEAGLRLYGPAGWSGPRDADRRYASFAAGCLELQARIKERKGVRLTPRQLDGLLMKRGRRALS